MTVSEEKRSLRNSIMRKAGEMAPAYKREAGDEVCRRVAALPEYRQAKTVFCFAGVGDEIDTVMILADALASGKTLCVPKCIAKGVMEARQITDLNQLTEGKFGLMEPEDRCGVIPPSEIDFAVIPCSTCNLSGHRLGFGGGFYDRYLADAAFFTCLICRQKLLTEDIPMEKHDRIPDMVITEARQVRLRFSLEISDLGYDGRGIGRTDGLTVFVPWSEVFQPVPGDTILAEITEVKQRYALAKMLSIKSGSPDRVLPFCDYAGQCGGCPLSGMRYEAQLSFKENQLRDKLMRIAGLHEPRVMPMIGMGKPLRYRNKARMPVDAGRAGFYRVKSHDVVDCKTCPVSAEPAEVLLDTLRDFIRENRSSAYSADTGKGMFRSLTVRTAEHTGEVMVILDADGNGIPEQKKLVEMMDAAVVGMPKRQDGAQYSLESVVLSGRPVAGKRTITDRMAGLRVEISPASFYQVNPAQARRLYGLVLRYADLTGAETVLDIYCGIGVIGLLCAANAREVIGIECEKEAITDANRNATINGIVNARFICGEAEKLLPGLVENGLIADVVIIDPPRAGCKAGLTEAVARANPERVIYVSCDTATLARDIKALCSAGYEFKEATPLDMFPHTIHVETVALLERRDT